MPYKKGVLLIDNFQRGVGASPYSDFSDMRNLDVYSSPGSCRINFKTVKKNVSTINDLSRWFAHDTVRGGHFAIGENVYYASSITANSYSPTNPTSLGAFTSGVVWKNYLFYFGASGNNGAISVYGPLSGTPAWTNSWKTITGKNSNSWYPSLVGVDDGVYAGFKNVVVSIREVPGQTFDPSNSATHTYNSAALDLPSSEVIRTMVEHGSDIYIGTYDLTPKPKSFIYPWDRLSQSFRLPIIIREAGIRSMISNGNLLYFFAGDYGNLYASNGITTQLLTGLPKHLFPALIKRRRVVDINPQGTMWYDGRLFFAPHGVANDSGPFGVYSYKDRKIVLENVISSGNYTGSSPAYELGAFLDYSQAFLVSSRDPTTGIVQIDIVGMQTGGEDPLRYTSYAAFLTSALYSIAPRLSPKTFTQLEVRLAKPLAADEGIKVEYRTAIEGNFTTLDTIDFATYGAIQTYQKSLSLSVTDIQIKVSLTTGSSSSTSPELLAVILR